jgi:hypothetical protein
MRGSHGTAWTKSARAWLECSATCFGCAVFVLVCHGQRHHNDLAEHDRQLGPAEYWRGLVAPYCAGSLFLGVVPPILEVTEANDISGAGRL